MEKRFLNKKQKTKDIYSERASAAALPLHFLASSLTQNSTKSWPFRGLYFLASTLCSCCVLQDSPSWVSFITVLSNLKSSLSETPLTFSFVSLRVYIVAVCLQSWLLHCLGAIFSMVGFPLQLQSPRVDVKLLLNGDRAGCNICHSTSVQVRSVNVTISLHQQTLIKCMWKHGNAFQSGCLDCNPTGVYEETQSKGGNDRAKGRSWDARRNHGW